MTEVRRSVLVNAGADHAFKVFTEKFVTWWPAAHHIGEADLKDVVVEPREGGRWYEIGTDGAECEWGEVKAWEPPGRLLLAWHLDAPVAPAEAVQLDGDSLEAEAWAYLAVRSQRALPITFPGTTGVPRPLAGGVLARP